MPAFMSMSQEAMLSAVTELDQALYAHEQWSEEINAALICRLVPDSRDVAEDSYRQCRFGQWYYSIGTDHLSGYPGFREIEAEHKRMHECAGQLLRASASGDTVALQDYQRYVSSLRRTRLEIQTLKRELETTLYNIDALTGVPGRMEMLRKLREQREFARRNVHRCTVAMLDIDNFKEINDRLGHLVGDRVLVDVVRYAQFHLRPYDMIFRYGGDEFLLCLPDADTVLAREICERLRADIAVERHLDDGTPGFAVTVSVGLAELAGDLPVEKVLDRADRALFAAKAAGRDRIVVWAPSMSEGGAMPHSPSGLP